MKKIQVGLVGYGLSGQVFHAPFLHAHPHFELKKVVERRQTLSQKDYPYVEVVRSYEELLNDDSIELVVITTPNEYHYPMIKHAIEKKKHVVVEKPFTETADQARELAEMANKHGVLVSVYQNRRFDIDFQTIKKVIEEGLVGEVVEYEAHFDRFRNFVREGTWKEEERPGSGILYDLGSHLIDQALTLFGMPNSVYATLSKQRPGSQIDDAFDLKMYYETKTVTLKASMLVREQGPRYQIHGTNGSFVKYGMDPQEAYLRAGGKPTDAAYGKESEEMWGTLNSTVAGLHFVGKVESEPSTYMNYYQDIYEAIIEERAPYVTAEQGARTIQIIEAAYESHRMKKVIEF